MSARFTAQRPPGRAPRDTGSPPPHALGVRDRKEPDPRSGAGPQLPCGRQVSLPMPGVPGGREAAPGRHEPCAECPPAAHRLRPPARPALGVAAASAGSAGTVPGAVRSRHCPRVFSSGRCAQVIAGRFVDFEVQIQPIFFVRLRTNYRDRNIKLFCCACPVRTVVCPNLLWF